MAAGSMAIAPGLRVALHARQGKGGAQRERVVVALGERGRDLGGGARGSRLHDLAQLVRAQGIEIDARHPRVGLLQPAGQRRARAGVVELSRPPERDDEQGQIRHPEQAVEDLDGRGVGVVDIVEDEHDRQRAGEALDLLGQLGGQALGVAGGELPGAVTPLLAAAHERT